MAELEEESLNLGSDSEKNSNSIQSHQLSFISTVVIRMAHAICILKSNAKHNTHTHFLIIFIFCVSKNLCSLMITIMVMMMIAISSSSSSHLTRKSSRAWHQLHACIWPLSTNSIMEHPIKTLHGITISL